MIKPEWFSSFVSALKKWLGKHPSDRELIQAKLEDFTSKPFDPELKNHKLSGQLKGLRVISVANNCRIVFSLVDDNISAMVSIGTHDEVF